MSNINSFWRVAAFFLVAAALVSAGCGKPANSADTDAKMREAYGHKAYKLSDIPPEQRAIVDGYMQGGKNGAVPAPPPAKPK